MGEPNNPCFKQHSVYDNWGGVTTTSTTQSPDQDIFILPTSGVPCPIIYFDNDTNQFNIDCNINTSSKNTFTCSSELYDPNPCIIEVDSYIKVASINIDLNQCSRYILKLEGQYADYFSICNLDLYIDSSVLNFNSPAQNYGVVIKLFNIESNNVIAYTSHSVYVNPCDCII